MGDALTIGKDGMPGATQLPLEPARAGSEAASVRFDLRILRAVRRIIRSVDLYSKQLLATSQITAPQLVCLLAVVDFGPLTVTAIGREVHLSPSTVVGILDRLEEKGWIVRTRTEDDRRMVLVSATPQGATLARQAPSPLQQTLATRLAALPELEQATIALSLERVVALMEAQERGAPPTSPAIPPESPKT
jgi:DNA-binding MarR family transcriptional regulator